MSRSWQGLARGVKRATPAARRRRSGDERGAAFVEFALVLPLFALLLFAAVDFGMVFGGYTTLRAQVQNGARLASVDQVGSGTCTGGPGGDTTKLVCEIAQGIGTPLGTKAGTLKVGISFYTSSGVSTLTGTVGGLVEVCAQVAMQSSTGLTAPFLDNRSVSSESTIRLDQAASYSTFSSGSVSDGNVTIDGYSCPTITGA